MHAISQPGQPATYGLGRRETSAWEFPSPPAGAEMFKGRSKASPTDLSPHALQPPGDLGLETGPSHRSAPDWASLWPYAPEFFILVVLSGSRTPEKAWLLAVPRFSAQIWDGQLSWVFPPVCLPRYRTSFHSNTLGKNVIKQSSNRCMIRPKVRSGPWHLPGSRDAHARRRCRVHDDEG